MVKQIFSGFMWAAYFPLSHLRLSLCLSSPHSLSLNLSLFLRLSLSLFLRLSLSLSLFLGLSPALSGQVESDERPLLVSQDGIKFLHDSTFQMTMRFRMQNRFGYFSTLDGTDAPGFEAAVRRLRLRFDGFVLNTRIGYYLQLSFSRSDQDLTSGTIAQTVRDAMVYYNVSDRLYFGFGQSKLPGNRERVVSSGNLQTPDRSIANSTFTLDRDFGVFGYYTQPIGRTQQLILKGTLTEGEGRGQTFTTSGLAYTGRIEWLPMGTFSNLGDYTAGDQEFELKPKLSVALSYCVNDRTTRSGGQLGSTLPNSVDMNTLIADMMFKYNGWGILGEYFNRKVDGYTLDDENRLAMNRIPRGQAFNIQISRMLGQKHELLLRYAGVNPEEGFEAFQYQYRTKALCYNYYLNKHRVKFQYYIGLDDRTHADTDGVLLHEYTNRLSSMIQVELGI